MRFSKTERGMIVNSKKTIILLTILVISVIIIALLLYKKISVNLELRQYQIVNQNATGLQYALIVDSTDAESRVEQELDIQIKEGVDYGKYSLLISPNYEITRYSMMLFVHPSKGENRKSIRLCDYEFGEKHENIIYIYIIAQTNIISRTELDYY